MCEAAPKRSFLFLLLCCYPQVVDFAPLAVRRSAFEAVGGLDEGLSEQGQCGIYGDWEMCTRMWADGWQVRCKCRTALATVRGAHIGRTCLAPTQTKREKSATQTSIPLRGLACTQVMHMLLEGRVGDDSGHDSGTHTPESGEKCWGRQMEVASSTYGTR